MAVKKGTLSESDSKNSVNCGYVRLGESRHFTREEVEDILKTSAFETFFNKNIIIRAGTVDIPLNPITPEMDEQIRKLKIKSNRKTRENSQSPTQRPPRELGKVDSRGHENRANKSGATKGAEGNRERAR